MGLRPRSRVHGSTPDWIAKGMTMAYSNDEFPKKGCLVALICGLVIIVFTFVLWSIHAQIYGHDVVFQRVITFARTWAIWPAVLIGASLCFQRVSSSGTTDVFSRALIGIALSLIIGALSIPIGLCLRTVDAYRNGDLEAWYDDRIPARYALRSDDPIEKNIIRKMAYFNGRKSVDLEVRYHALEELVMKRPDNVDYLVAFGQENLINKNYDNAHGIFKRALDLKPRNIDSIIGLASSYEGMGKIALAIQVLEGNLNKSLDKERISRYIEKLRNVDSKATRALDESVNK
jgi:hypothetical protein